jgi:hypothetical protein
MSNFENPFIPKSELKKEPAKKEGISRREFLKSMAKVAGAATIAGVSIRRYEDELLEYLSKLASEDNNKEKNEEKNEPADPVQEKNLEEDAKSIRELIDFNNPKRIEFNLQTAEALKNYWKE